MRRRLELAGIGAFALLLAVVALAGLLRAGSGARLGGEYVDAYGTQWFYSYVAGALRRGAPLTHADALFYPWGKDLLTHDGANVLDAVLAAPWVLGLGPAAGYNIFVGLAFAAGVWAFWRFAREVAGEPEAAAAATLVFAVQPWPLRELAEGRPTQALLGLLVVFLHALWRLGRGPGWRAPVVAGVALALLGYQYWYYALFAGMAAVAAGLVTAASPPAGAGGRGAVFLRHAAAAGLAGLLVAPVAAPVLRATSSGGVPGLLAVAGWSAAHTPPVTVEGSAVTLQEWQPLAGWFGYHTVEAGGERFIPAAAGLPALLVLAGAVWVGRPGRLPRRWVGAILVVAGLVAVGPVLLVGRTAFPNAAYLALVQAVPVFQRLWWPARAYALVAVVAPLCFAAGCAGRRFRLRGPLTALVVAGSLLTLRTEALLPFPTWTPPVEAGYRCLAAAPEGALAEVPWSWSQRHLVAQAVHGHPLLGGMNERDTAFTPPELLALQARNPLVRALTTSEGFAPDRLQAWSAADVAELGALGYRWIAVQLDAFVAPPDASLALRLRQTRLRTAVDVLRAAFGPPVWSDARMMIWAPWGGGSPCADAPPAPDTAALGRTERSPPMRPADAFRISGDRRVVPFAGGG